MGKPLAVLNKWGEEPSDGAIYKTALVTFKKNKAVEKALALSGGMLGDRQVIVGLNTRPPPQRKQAVGSCRVFVGNLPFNADDAAVRSHFASCGKVLFVRFATTKTKGAKAKSHHAAEIPAGYAFVIFEDPDGRGAAAHAAIALDGSMLCERTISVAPAVEKSRPSADEGEKRGKGRPPRARRPGAARDGGEGLDRERKRLRPAEWRHDKTTGLTAPRPKKQQARDGSGSSDE